MVHKNHMESNLLVGFVVGGVDAGFDEDGETLFDARKFVGNRRDDSVDAAALRSGGQLHRRRLRHHGGASALDIAESTS